jgi:hypothetical protein
MSKYPATLVATTLMKQAIELDTAARVQVALNVALGMRDLHVHAFGYLLYQLFTGRAPFEGRDDGELEELQHLVGERPDMEGLDLGLGDDALSKQLRDLIEGCWAPFEGRDDGERPDLEGLDLGLGDDALSKQLRDLIEGCWAQDSSKRPGAEKVVDDMRWLLASITVQPVPARMVGLARKICDARVEDDNERQIGRAHV